MPECDQVFFEPKVYVYDDILHKDVIYNSTI
jgi:hypothetical protein